MTLNVAVSIRERLLNKAKSVGAEFELFLVRYACERFLYRLGESSVRERCILKGANLLALWMEAPFRATRDIDLLTYGESDERAVREVMATICNVPCPEDGMIFDVQALQVSPIKDNQRYDGQRAKLLAFLGRARISLQVDFGFGDVVVPGPIEAQMHTLIGGVPAPVLHTYPRVSTIAEKFEAMVQLGTRNSRMKDFYDIWALSETFAFDGAELQEAVARCFERRGTDLLSEMPEILTPGFYSEPQMQGYWMAYRNQGSLLALPPVAFEAVGERILAFLGPARASILTGEQFRFLWSAGGPWRRSTIEEEG